MAVIERYSPQARVPSWIRFQHQSRYEWVGEKVRGKKVVDAACGCGFGARMLAEAGAVEVRAFDLDDDAVQDATERCGDFPQVIVRQGDVTRLPLEDASVDLYVCFETIEHVDNDVGVVDEAWRVLKPGGCFFCSSPNRTVTNPGTTIVDHPFNPHHVREYSRTEFATLLSRRFASVELFGQTPFSGAWSRRLSTISKVHRMLAVRCHQLRKLAGMYWDRAERHVPRSCDATTEPEFLVASCVK